MTEVEDRASCVSLAAIDAILRDAVALVASTDPNPADPFRGLYISDDDAVESAAGLDGSALDERLAGIGELLGLDALDCGLLGLCAAPELDPRYGRLVAYLHDDVTRRRPSPRLLARLLGGPDASHQDIVLARLGADGRLRGSGAVRMLDAEDAVPIAERGLAVDGLLVAGLLGAELGSAAPPGGVRDVAATAPAPGRLDVVARLARLLAGDDAVVVACVGPDAEQVLAHAAGTGLVAIAATRLADDELRARAKLRATLRGAPLAISEVERLGADERPAFLAALARLDGPRFLVGPRDAHAGLLDAIAVHAVEVPDLTAAERRSLWAEHVPRGVAAEVSERYLLSASQIADALALARAQSRERADDGLREEHILGAAREVSRRSLGGLAQRLLATRTWDELVLPPAEHAQLRAIAGFVRHRDQVLGDWGFGALAGPARGLTALFAGESGTGKTLAAQVVANDLGLDIYRVDLAGIVSKYIGETEKNLERVFRAAEDANAVLLFDEADALFGKRSPVTDARDRYANIEVAYLLQRIEQYPGIVILTTNMRQDVDQAFLRRLDFAVEFPLPGPEQRAELWRRHLPASAPVAEDLDLERLATASQLPGGAIRNAARAAAFAAAGDGGTITMALLERAVSQEMRKLGRLNAR